MKLLDADLIAAKFIMRLAPFCQRIDIAGSITRREPEVKDADFVLIPKMHAVEDMFHHPTGETWSEVDEQLGMMLAEGILKFCKDRHDNDIDGPKHKKLQLLHHDLVIELWIVTPPAQFGVIKLLRTGPADFSHQVVTKRNRMTDVLSDGRRVPGLLPSVCTMNQGRVLINGNPVDMPEEIDFFRLMEIAWIPPESRRAGYLDSFVKWPK